MNPNETFRQYARENRERAEAAGIGRDSELSHRKHYTVEEYLGRKLTPYEGYVIAVELVEYWKRWIKTS